MHPPDPVGLVGQLASAVVCEHFVHLRPALLFSWIFLSLFLLNLPRVRAPAIVSKGPVHEEKALGQHEEGKARTKHFWKCRKDEFTRARVAVPLIFP